MMKNNTKTTENVNNPGALLITQYYVLLRVGRATFM